MIRVVLFQPEIPPNTGNIARLCVCNEIPLHIIHPIGFSLSKKHRLKAGMDYWEHLDLTEHVSWEAFLKIARVENLFFFSARSGRLFWEMKIAGDAWLIFGSESVGLPRNLHEQYAQRFYTIPMAGPRARCLNLSSAAAAGVYEALRQQQQDP